MRSRSSLILLAAVTLSATAAVTSTTSADAAGTVTQQHWKLDPQFGTGGIVRTDFPIQGGHYSWGLDSVVQPDGRTLVAGVATSQVSQLDDVAVARYLPDGRLDSSFGSGGRVLVGPHPLYWPTAIALQKVNGQQKILMAVRTTDFDPLRYRCSVMRLNPDGSLDSRHDADPGVSFGSGGIKVLSLGHNAGFCGGLALTPDNKIVVTAEAATNGGDVGLFQLRGADGALDEGFGDHGKVIIAAKGYQVPRALTLEPVSGDSPLIVIGGLISCRHGYDWALWRLTSDGQPDATFGKNGRVVTAMRDPRVETSYDAVDALAVTANGDLLASGRYRAWPDGALEPQDTAAAAEYHADGTLDKAFGAGGRVHIPWDSHGSTEAEDVTIDATGNILFAGALDMPTRGLFLVGGFTADGHPDRRFGSSGYHEFVVGGGYDGASSLTLDPAGRLVVAGTSGDPGQEEQDQFGVARFRLNPQAR